MSATLFGKYKLRRELGRGAMGLVFEAYDPHLERSVAIKTLKGEFFGEDLNQPDARARFRREAKLAAGLTHPRIVTVHDFGETNDTAYLVMEFLNGRSLKEHLDAGRHFDPDETVGLILQLLDALDYAHQRGIIHRDIKPANLMLLDDGNLKVMDFGIARLESSSTLTKSGVILGTPSYMSPEQCRNLPLDRRSDLFSAGVILYELLVGERPFNGGSAITLIHNILNTEPPAPSELNALLATNYDAVIRKALAKNSDARYQTAGDFARSLRAAQAGSTINLGPEESVFEQPAPPLAPTPKSSPTVEALPPPKPINPWVRYVLFATALIGAIVGGLVWLGSLEPSPDRESPQSVSVYRLRVPPPIDAGPSTISDPVAIELAFWESIKSSTDRRDFEEYLRKYPEGSFGGLARNRLENLRAATSTAVLANPTTVSSDNPTAPTNRAEQGDEEAARLVLQAAEQGDPSAMMGLGVLYLRGKGVKQDDKKAAAWLNRAAEQGNAQAMFELAQLYEAGRGVKADLPTATLWYERAGKAGDQRAQLRLRRLQK